MGGHSATGTSKSCPPELDRRNLGTGLAFGFSGPQAIIAAAVGVPVNQMMENRRLPGSLSYEVDQMMGTYTEFKDGGLGSLGDATGIESRPRTWGETFYEWTPWFWGGGWGD